MSLFPGRSRNIGEFTPPKEKPSTSGSKKDKQLFFGKKKQPKYHIEELIDINGQLEYFRENRVNMLNPRTIYRVGIFDSKQVLFRQYYEIPISITDGQSELFDIISDESVK